MWKVAKHQERTSVGSQVWTCLKWLMILAMVHHTCHQCSKVPNLVPEKTISLSLPLVHSPVWSLVQVKISFTFPPVDGVGDLTVLSEVMAKDGGFLPSQTVFIMMLLSYIRVSLSRLSIRNYVLDLNPNSLFFIAFCYCTKPQQKAN